MQQDLHLQAPATSTVATGGLSARALHLALAYIDTHLLDRITLPKLAAHCCVSRFHFARMFRISTGHSPMEYVRAQRMQRAKAMLLEGGHRISDIATSLGFFDQSHFVRRFRDATGLTPSGFARLSSPPTLQPQADHRCS